MHAALSGSKKVVGRRCRRTSGGGEEVESVVRESREH